VAGAEVVENAGGDTAQLVQSNQTQLAPLKPPDEAIIQ